MHITRRARATLRRRRKENYAPSHGVPAFLPTRDKHTAISLHGLAPKQRQAASSAERLCEHKVRTATGRDTEWKSKRPSQAPPKRRSAGPRHKIEHAASSCLRKGRAGGANTMPSDNKIAQYNHHRAQLLAKVAYAFQEHEAAQWPAMQGISQPEINGSELNNDAVPSNAQHNGKRAATLTTPVCWHHPETLKPAENGGGRFAKE